MPSQTEALRMQRLSRQYLNSFRDRINEFARRVERLGEEILAATATLSEHESLNGEFARQAAEKIGVYLLILLCFVGGYLLDCLVFAAPIEFLCSLVNWPVWAQTLAQFAAPVALLAFEALIAFTRFTAQEEAEYGKRGAVWFWTVLGLLPAIVAAGFAIATHWVNAEHTALTPGFMMLGVVLGVWALIVHLVVLLSGRHQHEAKAYLVFIAQRRRMRRRLTQLTRERDRVVDALNNAFANYLQGLTTHNNAYRENQLGAGPFNLAARAQLQTLFGPQVFQDQEVTGGNTVSTAPPASSQSPTINQAAQRSTNETHTAQTQAETHATSADSSEDYYRTILSRTVRDRDSEVQP